MTTGEGRHWTENFRVLTPILVTVAIFLLGSLLATVNKMDDKMFKHFTNDEIHAPRSQFVENTKFDMYQKMIEKQMLSNENVIIEIRNMIYELTCNLRQSNGGDKDRRNL